jgi:hypothetical protein
MPAVSKAQQKLFGIVHAVQTGRVKGDKFGPEVRKLARTMSADDVKKYATTKIKDLPNKIRQMLETPETDEYGVPVTDTPPASSEQPHISNDPKLVSFNEESVRDQIVKWKDETGKEHEAKLGSIYGDQKTYPKGSPARRAADQIYARHKNPQATRPTQPSSGAPWLDQFKTTRKSKKDPVVFIDKRKWWEKSRNKGHYGQGATTSNTQSTSPSTPKWPAGGDDRTWFDKYSSRSKWESQTPEQMKGIVEEYSQKQSKIFSVLKDKKPTEIDGVMIDIYTAALLTKVLKKLSTENREKLLKLPMEKMVATAYKLVTR